MARYTTIRLPNDAPSLDLDGPVQSEGDAALNPEVLRQERERHVIDYLLKTFETEVLGTMKKKEGERLHISAKTLSLKRGPEAQVIQTPAGRSIAVPLSNKMAGKYIALINRKEPGRSGLECDVATNYSCARGTALVLDEGMTLAIPAEGDDYPD
ncbi:uncharacterized protein LMH87_007620 [Akanthomyces muscarius]|uniref:Uncharacterized protein n=1 Tax=Akanthomyces muscarius TaxID=2231603 RepID=A0A9W8URA7_AKAMU|nr:uncharacterized protein LMH87_007620 [Akanthomyces muscarius]KAJ4161589.1 hypothetical protein LMH87_007620 [Akanthomyces muscarius]